MKTWQKIVGIGVVAVIVICEALIGLNAYVDLKYIVEPTGLDDVIERGYLYVGALSLGMWLNFALAVALFICLCLKRK